MMCGLGPEESYLHEVTMVTPSRLGLRHTLFTSLKATVQGVCHPFVLSGLAILFSASACSPRYDDMPAYWPIPSREYDNYGPGRFKTALLADQIDRHYRGSVPGPIGVTTFVNIDDLYASSTFGRMVGEQLMSELTMKGFDVVELRHADALQFLDTSGEFALSRDARAVRPTRNLSAVVVGTYTTSPERVYVNARLVDPATSLVLSAGSVEMSKTRELAKLLRGGSVPGSLERIPVRHLGNSASAINPFDPARRRWEMEESEWSMGPSYRSRSSAELPVLTNDPAKLNGGKQQDAAEPAIEISDPGASKAAPAAPAAAAGTLGAGAPAAG
jgi:TolB-like protein